MKFLIGYLIVMNIVSFLAMCIDKHRARRHRWRIAERTLFLLALLGGSGGALLAMWLLWHKVRTKIFVVGLPLLLILHLLIAALLHLL